MGQLKEISQSKIEGHSKKCLLLPLGSGFHREPLPGMWPPFVSQHRKLVWLYFPLSRFVVIFLKQALTK